MPSRKPKMRTDGVVVEGPPGEVHALPANERTRPTNGPGANNQFPPGGDFTPPRPIKRKK